MPWSLIASGGGHGQAGGPVTRDTRGADLIVIAGLLSAAGGRPFTDNLGNTWLVAGETGTADPSNYSLGIYYCRNPIVGATHTFSTSVAFGHILMAAYAGSAASPFDVIFFGRPSSDQTSGIAGPITPTADDALVLAITSHGGLPGSAAGLTTIASVPGTSGQYYGGLMAAVVQATAASIQSSLTWPTAERPQIAMVAFKGTGAAPVGPAITTQPTAQTVTEGQAATFSVVATGSAPLSYQWRKDGAPISGATSASYTTPATVLGDNGALFSVVVTNSVASVTSGNALLTVNAAPPPPSGAITGTAVSGQTVTISGTYSGNVTGATATLAAAAPANGAQAQGPVVVTVGAGTFTVTFTAVPAGSYAPSLVTLTGLGGVTPLNGTAFEIIGVDGQPEAGATLAAPVITVQPAAQSVTAPAAATFSVIATGTAPLAYQWRRNGVNIAGATSASYTLSPTQTGDSGASFSVVVSNGVGSVTSASAALTVAAGSAAPSITAQPQAVSVTEGQQAAFSVTATGTAPLTYQWRRNGVNITGATAASLTFTAQLADNAAIYSCVVSNGSGSATSTGVALTVSAVPVVPVSLAAWRDLAPTIAMDLPDCPVFTIEDGLREAARRLYRKTRAWRSVDMQLAVTVADQAAYSVAGLPQHSELAGLPQLTAAGRDLEELRPSDESDSDSDSWTCGRQYRVQQTGPASIALVPAPTIAGEVVRGIVALAPTPTAPGISALLWAQHSEGIQALARAILMEQLGKPWSNPGMAQLHRATYNRLAGQYGGAAGVRSKRPRLQVRPSPF